MRAIFFKSFIMLALLLMIFVGCNGPEDEQRAQQANRTGHSNGTLQKASKKKIPPLKSQSVKRANEFSFILMRQLIQSEKDSFVASPLSIRMSLALMNFGARGQTQEQIASALKLKPDCNSQAKEDKQIADSFAHQSGLMSFHSLIRANGIQLTSQFANSAVENYSAKLASASGLSDLNLALKNNDSGEFQSSITRWDPQLKLVILSGLQYQSTWVAKFDPKKTRPRKFYGKETKLIDMMSHKEVFATAQSDDLAALKLDMQNDCSLVLILPGRKKSLLSCLKIFDHDFLEFLMTRDLTENNIVIPKWQTNSKIDLKPHLESLGVSDVFSKSANLLGVSENEDLYLSQVVQQAKITVNEEGSAAKIVSESALYAKGEPLPLVFNRPFLYLIVRKSDNLILLTGQFLG